MKSNKVIACCFSSKKRDLENHLLSRLPKQTPFKFTEKSNNLLAKVPEILENIYNGKNMESYEAIIDVSWLSSYSRKVLKYTSMIPVGYVTTYGALSKVAVGSARSVGRVEASNPVPLLIPCHRVVRSDLNIGGYGYGTKTKFDILMKEKRGYLEPKKLKVEDKELSLFPTEWIKQHRQSLRVKQ